MTSRVGHILSIALRLRMLVILAAIVLASSLVAGDKFTSVDNLINVLRQVSFEATLAFAVTLIIATGGIDLSVGSMIGLCGVACALVLQAVGGVPLWLGVALAGGAAAAGGCLVGAASGTIIAVCSIPPFIVTLSVMLVARGLAFIMCDGQPVYDLPEGFSDLGRGYVLQSVLGRTVPVPVVLMLSALAVFSIMLKRTVFGRRVLAIGDSEEAARRAGIPIRRTKVAVYALCGLMCGVVATFSTAKLGAGDPKVGEMWELNVIAAVVVGGTSLFGGRATMVGTLIGALIIGVLNNTLNLLHVEHFWQKVALGVVILLAALADAGLRKLEAARS